MQGLSGTGSHLAAGLRLAVSQCLPLSLDDEAGAQEHCHQQNGIPQLLQGLLEIRDRSGPLALLLPSPCTKSTLELGSSLSAPQLPFLTHMPHSHLGPQETILFSNIHIGYLKSLGRPDYL